MAELINDIDYFNVDLESKLASTENSISQFELDQNDVLHLDIYSGENFIENVTIPAIDNIEILGGSINIDYYDILVNTLGFVSGFYRIQTSILRNPIYPNVDVRVDEISRNKTELRLDGWTDDAALVGIRDKDDDGYKTLRLVHDKAGTIRLINWTEDTHNNESTIIVKVADDLPRSIKAGDTVQLFDDIINPFEIQFTIQLDDPSAPEDFNILRGPNLTLDVNREIGKPTALSSWNDILSADVETNSRVVDKVFSGSLGATLNIDYSSYENFVHFSSAEERLRNFKYKLQLIESYKSTKSNITSSATGSSYYIAVKTDMDDKIAKLVGTFDGYEQHMYFNSASEYTDTYGTHPDTTWPKTTQTKPYTVASTLDVASTDWFDNQMAIAADYDLANDNSLRSTIPLHIKLDSGNNGYVLFVDMVSQHFDEVYNHVDHLKNIHSKDEDVNVGLSKDLLFDVLSSFGWKPESGLDLSNIWSYYLGTNKTGTNTVETSSAEYPNGATIKTVTGETMSIQDIEAEPWSRILNNLPYLLKTKGTARGVKALMSCYGIPSTILKIQEFGGPDPIDSSIGSNNEILQAGYMLKFNGTDSYLRTDWDNNYNTTPINTIELRFKTNTIATMSLCATSYNIAGIPASSLWIEPESSGQYGIVKYSTAVTKTTSPTVITYASTSLARLPIYDNDWWNVSVKRDVITGNISLACQKSPDHAGSRITHAAKSSVPAPLTPYGWTDGGIEYFDIGKSSSAAKYNDTNNVVGFFNGHMQEVRLWDNELSDDVIDVHTKAPVSILGNSYTGSYDNLLFRLPMGADTNRPDVTVANISSSHPNQSTTRTATINGTFAWTYNEEDYFTPVPNSIGMRGLANKIRVEDNVAVGDLHPNESVEVSSGMNNPIDSNLLFVGFSPQAELDADISLQFGGLSIDDIVGDPRDNHKSEYTGLAQFRNAYFKKYNGKQNIWAFMRMVKYFNTALFKQIESMLPARANKIVGLVVKQTMLERPKIVTEPVISYEDMHHQCKINVVEDGIVGNMPNAVGTQLYDAAGAATHKHWTSYVPAKLNLNVIKCDTDGLMQNASNSRNNSKYQSNGLTHAAQLQTDFTGMNNLIVEGCKMTSDDFNIDSPDTVDGKPVVEVFETNPNKLITDNTSHSGDIKIV